MSAFAISVLYVLIWRLSVLACGIVSVVLGYRLFQSGFAAREGSLEASAGGGSVKVSNLAPGTFFALFGAAIISTLIWTTPAEIVIPKEAFASTAPDAVDMGAGGLVVRGK